LRKGKKTKSQKKKRKIRKIKKSKVTKQKEKHSDKSKQQPHLRHQHTNIERSIKTHRRVTGIDELAELPLETQWKSGGIPHPIALVPSTDMLCFSLRATCKNNANRPCR
jgi:hypothetical protein